MRRAAAAAAALLLLGCSHVSAADRDACDLYAAAGRDRSLSFAYEGLTDGHLLKWTHNGTEVIPGKLVQPQGKLEVDSRGSLSLRNLQFSAAGTYRATVLHPNGTAAAAWSGRLCVMHAVGKPELAFVCDFRAGAAILSCGGEPVGSTFSWTRDRSTLAGETRQTLSVPLERLAGGSFACGVHNRASSAHSDAVRPACKGPPAPVCLPVKTFGAMVAGAGGLVLVLVVIIATLCRRHKRATARMRLGHRVELGMRTRGEPDPGTTCAAEVVSQPEGGSESRPAQLAADAAEPRASPVPKPRTKIGQTADTEDVVK